MRQNGRLADRGQGPGAAERETPWPQRGLKLLNFNAETQCTPSRSAPGLRPRPARTCHRTLPEGNENILQGGSKWCGSLAAASST